MATSGVLCKHKAELIRRNNRTTKRRLYKMAVAQATAVCGADKQLSTMAGLDLEPRRAQRQWIFFPPSVSGFSSFLLFVSEQSTRNLRHAGRTNISTKVRFTHFCLTLSCCPDSEATSSSISTTPDHPSHYCCAQRQLPSHSAFSHTRLVQPGDNNNSSPAVARLPQQ